MTTLILGSCLQTLWNQRWGHDWAFLYQFLNMLFLSILISNINIRTIDAAIVKHSIEDFFVAFDTKIRFSDSWYQYLTLISLVATPLIQTLWYTALKTSRWLLISTQPGVNLTISSSSDCFSSSNTSHWMITFSSSILRRSATRSNIPNPWNKQNTEYYEYDCQISTYLVAGLW